MQSFVFPIFVLSLSSFSSTPQRISAVFTPGIRPIGGITLCFGLRFDPPTIYMKLSLRVCFSFFSCALPMVSTHMYRLSGVPTIFFVLLPGNFDGICAENIFRYRIEGHHHRQCIKKTDEKGTTTSCLLVQPPRQGGRKKSGGENTLSPHVTHTCMHRNLTPPGANLGVSFVPFHFHLLPPFFLIFFILSEYFSLHYMGMSCFE